MATERIYRYIIYVYVYNKTSDLMIIQFYFVFFSTGCTVVNTDYLEQYNMAVVA